MYIVTYSETAWRAAAPGLPSILIHPKLNSATIHMNILVLMTM